MRAHVSCTKEFSESGITADRAAEGRDGGICQSVADLEQLELHVLKMEIGHQRYVARAVEVRRRRQLRQFRMEVRAACGVVLGGVPPEPGLPQSMPLPLCPSVLERLVHNVRLQFLELHAQTLCQSPCATQSLRHSMLVPARFIRAEGAATACRTGPGSWCPCRDQASKFQRCSMCQWCCGRRC